MRDPRALRRRAGITGDPQKDQYFLEDERVLDRIVGYATSSGFDLGHVLEIGPGTGALTARLLSEANHITAIERDKDLVAFLRGEFAAECDAGDLTIIEGDALEVDIPAVTASISNLPYGISSPVLFRLLPRRMSLLVLVQREFGERMAASVGTDAYGRLSVAAQHYGDVEVMEIVPPSVFSPAPPVESAVVKVVPRPPTYDVVDEQFFLGVVQAIFTQRRKTLRNAIRNTTHISRIGTPTDVLDALDEATLSKRPGSLPPETFAKIANIAWEYRKQNA